MAILFAINQVGCGFYPLCAFFVKLYGFAWICFEGFLSFSKFSKVCKNNAGLSSKIIGS